MADCPIPEDIMQAAREALAFIYDDPDHSEKFHASIIARAILAERERAATRIERLEALADIWAKEINRRVEVEQTLWNVAGGKRSPLTPDECRALAIKLGVSAELMNRAALAGKAGE